MQTVGDFAYLFNLKTNKKNMWLTVLKFYTKYNDIIGISFNSEVIRNINPIEKALLLI